MRKTYAYTLATLLVFCFAPQTKAKAEDPMARARAAAAIAEAELAIEKNEQIELAPMPREQFSARRMHCLTDLGEAQTKARLLNLPLVIWVAMNCDDEPQIRDAFDSCGAIGCHQSSYNGSSVPRIVIPRGTTAFAFPRSHLRDYTPSEVASYATAKICPNGQCPVGPCAGNDSCLNGACLDGSCSRSPGQPTQSPIPTRQMYYTPAMSPRGVIFGAGPGDGSVPTCSK